MIPTPQEMKDLMHPGDLLILATTHLPKAHPVRRDGSRKSRNYASLVDWINDEIREAARVLNVTLVDQSDILGEGQLCRLPAVMR